MTTKDDFCALCVPHGALTNDVIHFWLPFALISKYNKQENQSRKEQKEHDKS